MIRFDIDWVDAEEWLRKFNAPDMFETLGDFMVSTPKSIITKHWHSQEKSITDYLLVQVSPAAESLIYWLYYREGYVLLLGSGDGNVYPVIVARKFGNYVYLRWKKRAHSNSYVEFLESGRLLIKMDKLEKIILEFCEKVLRRLRSKGVHGTELELYMKKYLGLWAK